MSVGTQNLSKDGNSDKHQAFGTFYHIESKFKVVPLLDDKSHHIRDASGQPIFVPAVLSSPKEIEDEVRQILGPIGYAFLHEGGTKDQNERPIEITTARSAFEEFLKRHIESINPAPMDKTTFENATTLKDFFTPENLKAKGKEKELAAYREEALRLYKAAIKEEHDSPAFRNAVFLRSIEAKKGVQLKKKQGIHIGGPSGGGKSHARDTVIKELMAQEKAKQIAQGKTPSENHVNHFVSVDGGIDRDTSQVRNLLFSSILKKGYKGAEDLQKASKGTALKTTVREAVLKSGKHLHLVIPDTYSNPLKQYGKKLFKKLTKHGYAQTFVVVKPNQEQTFVSGNRRAWMKLGSKPVTAVDKNMKDKPEGKAYDPELFKTGERSSNFALGIFKVFTKGRTFEIDNDVHYYKKDDKSPSGYTVCSREMYDADIVTTKRLFTAFENFNQHILTQQLKALLNEYGSQSFTGLFIEKSLIREIESAPSFKRKQEILQELLDEPHVFTGLAPGLADRLKNLQQPVLEYKEWTKDVTIQDQNNNNPLKNYEYQLWLASDRKIPLGPEWKQQMEKQFGVQITETTHPSVKEKIAKEELAESQISPSAKNDEPQRRKTVQLTTPPRLERKDDNPPVPTTFEVARKLTTQSETSERKGLFFSGRLDRTKSVSKLEDKSKSEVISEVSTRSLPKPGGSGTTSAA